MVRPQNTNQERGVNFKENGYKIFTMLKCCNSVSMGVCNKDIRKKYKIASFCLKKRDAAYRIRSGSYPNAKSKCAVFRLFLLLEHCSKMYQLLKWNRIKKAIFRPNNE